jgi:DNA-binding CsgD family transcriptional regulator
VKYIHASASTDFVPLAAPHLLFRALGGYLHSVERCSSGRAPWGDQPRPAVTVCCADRTAWRCPSKADANRGLKIASRNAIGFTPPLVPLWSRGFSVASQPHKSDPCRQQNGDESEAIDHALAAEDFERAADLVELAIPTLRRGIAPSYVRRLLAALNKSEDSTPANQALIEPLSERELEVIRLLGTDLDGPDSARELVVSLNTVRTHTKSIYAKLGVNNRRAAVRRAQELDLMSRTRDR